MKSLFKGRIGWVFLGFFVLFANNGLYALDPAKNAELAAKYQKWGFEVMEKIQKDYYLDKSKLYASQSADTPKDRREQKRDPAMMWACGVMLSSLAEATEADPNTYSRRLQSYATAMDVYIQKDELGGYDVLPCPKPFDRYYDDNVWVVLAMIKASEVTQKRQYIYKAEAAMKFVLSGEDDKAGGGIYWKETGRVAKHTCSTAPSIVACLELYNAYKGFVNNKKSYLDTALRLHTWIRATLQDSDGLYWDNININGKVDKAKYSYNSALMIRAECLLYEETGDQKYLEEAQRVAKAALKRWVRDNGSADDGGRFAHLLIGSFLALYEKDNDPVWLDTVDRMIEYVHANIRDPNGLYSGGWKDPVKGTLEKVDLLDQASVAHAYLEVGNMHKNLRNKK